MKSDITRKLATTSTQVASLKFGIVVELYPIIKSKQSFTWPRFDRFSKIMCRSIIYIPSGYKLCDFVANQYFIGSFKKGTGKKRADDSLSLLVIISSRPASVISSATL